MQCYLWDGHWKWIFLIHREMKTTDRQTNAKNTKRDEESNDEFMIGQMWTPMENHNFRKINSVRDATKMHNIRYFFIQTRSFKKTKFDKKIHYCALEFHTKDYTTQNNIKNKLKWMCIFGNGSAWRNRMYSAMYLLCCQILAQCRYNIDAKNVMIAWQNACAPTLLPLIQN